MGAEFILDSGALQVRPMPPLAAPVGDVDCGESGSSLRFFIPLCSLSGKPATFTGAPRLFARPLGAYADIFSKQGLRFELGENSLTVQGPLNSGEFSLRGDVSSQFISGLLFALPLLRGDSTVYIVPPFESRSYVELTRSAQALFGVHSTWARETTLKIPGGQRYTPTVCTVEGDWSQAAVPAVVAAVRGGISIAGLLPNSQQGDKAILDVLRRCGADIKWENNVLKINPPAKWLAAPGDVDIADCPDLGPILCTLAAFCRGTTRLVNAGRLHAKESDRIVSMRAELGTMGVHVESTEDTVTIERSAALLPNAAIQSHNDHRVVMAMYAAALCAGVPVTMDGAEAVNKSWPTFFEDFTGLGAQITLD
jgi:3-phosphoshikimate 1-carboxyvinyltransferase